MVKTSDKMTQKNWEDMSNQQRYDYLSDGEIIIKKQAGLRRDAKIGDDNMVVISFAASCLGVQISHWCETNLDAMKQAVEFMESLIS